MNCTSIMQALLVLTVVPVMVLAWVLTIAFVRDLWKKKDIGL